MQSEVKIRSSPTGCIYLINTILSLRNTYTDIFVIIAIEQSVGCADAAVYTDYPDVFYDWFWWYDIYTYEANLYKFSVNVLDDGILQDVAVIPDGWISATTWALMSEYAC